METKAFTRGQFCDVQIQAGVEALAADASELGFAPGCFPDAFSVDGLRLERGPAEWRNYASTDRELLSVSYSGPGMLVTIFNE